MGLTNHRRDKRRRLLIRWCGLSFGGTVAVAVAGLIVMISRPRGEAVPAAGAHVAGLTHVLAQRHSGRNIPIRFEDVTRAAELRFRHMPVKRESFLPEDMGSGIACADYDLDGYTDLFLVNFSGNVAPGSVLSAEEGRARLYRNLGGIRFEDVTDRAGVGLLGYGMGAAWGDYDNDGDPDLYVTAYGNNILYQNLGDGTFRDVTAAAGVQDSRFSTGCSWGDYDRDGDLDLYVCNYVDFVFRESDRTAITRQYSTEQPYTLNPSAYAPQPNSLFRNRGDGSFEEVAATAGVANPTGRSLSATWVDLDNDGWIDLYVANDISENGVYRNRRDATFEDIGASSLAADYRGAMGLAVADFDSDLDQDIVITHWLAQENALYKNMLLDPVLPAAHSRLWFMDEADAHGLGQISLDMVGWATGFCDFDNDGLLDLWVVNGSTIQEPGDPTRLQPQRPFLFGQRDGGKFVEVGAQTCDAFASPVVGRGGAQLDFDLDGRVDLIFLVHQGGPILLRNASDPVGHFLRLTLRQKGGNTHALGARAYVTADRITQMAEVGTGSSYLSQHELPLHFGLGSSSVIDSIRIVWPDGAEEIHRRLPVDQRLTLTHAAVYPPDLRLTESRRQAQTARLPEGQP